MERAGDLRSQLLAAMNASRDRGRDFVGFSCDSLAQAITVARTARDLTPGVYITESCLPGAHCGVDVLLTRRYAN